MSRHLKVFDQLLLNEFCEPSQQVAKYTQRVFQFINYAIRAVPYYRERQSRYTLKKQRVCINDLAALPSLDRQEVQTHYRL